MSSIKPPFDRIIPGLRRAWSGVGRGHIVALSVVGAAAFGLLGLRAVELPGPRPISDSERLRIELVQPVEPEVGAGSVMEVGALVDEFQGLPAPLPTLTRATWSYDDAWQDEDESWAPRRGDGARVSQTWDDKPRPEPERPTAIRTVQRWFGFDAPRRNYQAERAARRARMEAIERDAYERRARERYASERYRRERAEDERYAYERRRAEEERLAFERRRAEADRYASQRRDEARRAPPWMDDRLRPPRHDPRLDEAGPRDWVEEPPYQPSDPPPGPRPYSERG